MLTTCKDLQEAEFISETLLKEKLVACVEISPAVQSLYLWQGELVKDNEVRLYLKTSEEKYPVAQRRLIELHSYDCPCVLKIDVESVNAACKDWITEVLG